MSRDNPQSVAESEVWEALEEYWTELHNSRLATKSVEDYWYFAECFVRWFAGEFTPGQNIKE